jgi:uncharacterized protein (DUF433 family)
MFHLCCLRTACYTRIMFRLRNSLLLFRARRLVVSDPEIMGGDAVFRGTRIPVHMIAELLVNASTQAELLEASPSHCTNDPVGPHLRRCLSATPDGRAISPGAFTSQHGGPAGGSRPLRCAKVSHRQISPLFLNS